MKRLCLLALCICLYACFVRAELRNDPFNTLPDSNSSAFRSQSRTFWGHEGSQREGELFQPFVVSGGLHGISSSLTSTAFATVAHVPERVNQVATAITYVAIASDSCWTILSSQDAAIAGWTRVGTTAYYFNCQGSATPVQPTLPSNSVWLMQVRITSSAINRVTDLRRTSSLGSSAVPYNLSDNGLRCDSGSDNSYVLQKAIDDAPVSGRYITWRNDAGGTCLFSQTLTIDKSNITIEGPGKYDPEVTSNPSRLLFTGTTGDAIVLGGTTVDRTNITLRNFDLLANAGVTGNGIVFKDGGGGVQVIRSLVENVSVTNFLASGKSGIRHEVGVENTFRRLNLSLNGYGISVVGGTTLTFSGVLVRSNYSDGFVIFGGQGLVIGDESVIESNQGNGLTLTASDGVNIVQVDIHNSWFENNNIGGAGYNINVTGSGSGRTIGLHIGDTTFNNPGALSSGDILMSYSSYSVVERIKPGAPAGKNILKYGTNNLYTHYHNILTTSGGALDPDGNAVSYILRDGTIKGNPLLDSTFRVLTSTNATQTLAIIAGTVDTTGPTIDRGVGFTVVRNGAGDVTITFTNAFILEKPTVVVSGEHTTQRKYASVIAETTAQIRIIRTDVSNNPEDGLLNFIAAGRVQ